MNSVDLSTIKLSVGRPNIFNRERFMERVEQILDTKVMTNDGPFVQELENAVKDRFAVKHCIAVSNATLGMELVLSALDLRGEIIVPSFTFVASAHAIRRSGCKPVFSDISSKTLAMQVSDVERLITEKTSAIMPVNIYGGSVDLDEFARLAEKYNLKLVYDSAHSLGSKWNGCWTGAFGDAEVFSLHATKFINGFEGGLITTNDSALARACALTRNFCFTGYEKVSGIGTNAKLSEIHAAMALTNFECLDQILLMNEQNHSWYVKYLPEQAELVGFDPRVTPNLQYAVVLLPRNLRNEIQERLQEHGVFARKYFYPGVHQFDCYRESYAQLAVTEDVAERVLCLPVGQDVTENDVMRVCQVMQSALS